MAHGSLIRALTIAYPNHKWEPLKRKRASIPLSLWRDTNSTRGYLEELSKKLYINNWEDWYKVSWTQLHSLGVYDKLHNRGGLKELLPKYFPEHSWQPEKLTGTRSKISQEWLKTIVSQIFPGTGTIFV
jgi:hypothetical protein